MITGKIFLDEMELYVMSDLQLCKSYDHEKKKFFTKGNFKIAMKTKNFLNLFTGYPTNKEKVRKRPGGRPEGKN